MWKEINDLVAMKKNKKKTMNCLKRSGDNSLTSNSSEISNIVNRRFAEVGPDMASGIINICHALSWPTR